MKQLIDNATLQTAYEQALEILQTVGTRFEAEEDRDVLKKAGAKVEGETVYIPKRLVQEALELIPRKKYEPSAQKRVAASTPFSNAPFVLDETSGKIRRCTIEDAIRLYQINETSGLYENSNPGCADPVGNDAPDQFIVQIAMLLKYSDKVPSLGLRATSNTSYKGDVYNTARKAFRLIREFYDVWDEPVMSQGICPNPPLTYDKECLNNLRAAIDEKQAVSIIPCTLGYLTGPESIMGVVTQDFALSLAGLVFVEFKSPEHPLSFNNCSTISNVRSMQPNYGSVESVYIQVLFYELCTLLGLPCSLMGGYSDGIAVDYQSGMESLLTALTPFGLTEVDEVWCTPGLLAGFACGSFQKAILDEEMIRNANWMLRGVEAIIDPDLPRLISEAQTEGSYLSLGSMETYRRDTYLTSVFNKWGVGSAGENEKSDLACMTERILQERVASYQLPTRDITQQKLLQPHLPSLCRY